MRVSAGLVWFLVVAATALVGAVLLASTAVGDAVDDYITGIPDDLRDLFADLESWVASVTVVEWVVLGIAVGLATWVYAIVRAASDLGPIVVEPVRGDDNNEIPGLTSQLRECINDIGLRPPPGVPSGAPAAHLLSAVKESPVPQANWIATLIEAMPRPSRVSSRLLTTKSGEEFRYWLCPTGIFPPWARWSEPLALEAYRRGLKATNLGEADGDGDFRQRLLRRAHVPARDHAAA